MPPKSDKTSLNSSAVLAISDVGSKLKKTEK